jgi:murein DD-endopeptidase MepM/ murein hydrolase activator NlpD
VRNFPIPRAYNYGYEPGFSATHQGVDIFAAESTPVVAVEDGLAYSRIEPKGGNAAYLEGDDGIVYYYGHLKSWDLRLLRPGKQPVKAGDPIGFVGTTGNAVGTSPHVHFQMRRRGTNTVLNPYDALVAADSEAPAGGTYPTPSALPLPLLAFVLFAMRGSGGRDSWVVPALLFLASNKTKG